MFSCVCDSQRKNRGNRRKEEECGERKKKGERKKEGMVERKNGGKKEINK